MPEHDTILDFRRLRRSVMPMAFRWTSRNTRRYAVREWLQGIKCCWRCRRHIWILVVRVYANWWIFIRSIPRRNWSSFMMISHWLRESFGYVPKEVPVDIMESRISLRIWGRSSFRGSGSAWERNRQAGIWRTMCWGDSRQRKSRRSVLRWSRR